MVEKSGVGSEGGAPLSPSSKKKEDMVAGEGEGREGEREREEEEKCGCDKMTSKTSPLLLLS